VTRIRPAAWLAASVTLFLLSVAGYALLVRTSPQYYWAQPARRARCWGGGRPEPSWFYDGFPAEPARPCRQAHAMRAARSCIASFARM
jgi:hypothetical protein